MRFAATVAAAAGVAAAAAYKKQDCGSPSEYPGSKRDNHSPRLAMYFDQWHKTDLPGKDITAGFTHVIVSFATSDMFASDPPKEYVPFMPLADIRAMFDDDVQVCLAVGGWGDNAGYDTAAASDRSRQLFAKNLANTTESLGFDCVDIDWEYPGGNGADYRQVPNSKKEFEIPAFPKLLKEVKKAIGDKELSIAVPGLRRDMIAYTAEQVPHIVDVVDGINVMTYDLMNRRDNITKHHTDVLGSTETIDTYLGLGVPPYMMALGLAFYAKWFMVAEDADCPTGLGCKTELLEAADGSDTGKSGSVTFEKSNFLPTPTNLTTTTDGTCGSGTTFKCSTTVDKCCSQYGWCGDTEAHCSSSCQSDYGECHGFNPLKSLQTALKDPEMDEKSGAAWYYDVANKVFWSWDTAELIERKYKEIVMTRGLGGVMAWSFGEDSQDYSHITAMRDGFNKYLALPSKK